MRGTALNLLALVLLSLRDMRMYRYDQSVCDTESISGSHSSAIYSYCRGKDREGRGGAKDH